VTADPFVVYSYVGTSARPLTEHSAEGLFTLRDDLRLRDGLLAAPLAIALLDCASANTRALATSAPTRIDLDLWDPAVGISDLRVRGRVVRHGRTQIFTDARIEDAADPGRVVGYGTTCFAVTGPPPASVEYGHDPLAPTSAPLTEVYGGRPRDDGGFDIPELTPALGHGRLHSGVMMVLAESAALSVVRRASGAGHVRTRHLGISLATSGKAGPFHVSPQLLGVSAGAAACSVEVVDLGADDQLVAVVSVGLQLSDD
jgi:acyl-coenzyme A thioesterase PaaI-like protein